MIKGITIFALSLIMSIAAYGNEASLGLMKFFQGEMDAAVEVTFSESNMEPRSYSSKCKGNIYFNNENDIYSFGLASYNCRYGIENDARMQFKAIDGQIFMVNVWGEVNQDRGVVGTMTDDVMSVQFDRKRTIKVPAQTLNDDGCLAFKTKWQDVELTDTLSYNFSYKEEQLAMTRTAIEQYVAPKMVRLGENCHPHYYRKHIVISKKQKIEGVLK
ncbi:MAG: hypothetical protein HN353_02445 [Bdellovibrionales bacterium]|jgi:hypothetical protein|nr:hypothetical protein [Bdellovibrionales bacterium]MBT3525546.1 hypothetical protein [Bdellovibrionales bacterium]MBT7667932.1 hypothetical protein [Bdellovibrionales bacterium]MBT7767668.1 hypothetical protein [Bdellovibrionales bacterium]